MLNKCSTQLNINTYSEERVEWDARSRNNTVLDLFNQGDCFNWISIDVIEP